MQKVTKITAPPSAPITLKSQTAGAEPAVPQTMTPGAPTSQVTPGADMTPMGVTIGQIPH